MKTKKSQKKAPLQYSFIQKREDLSWYPRGHQMFPLEQIIDLDKNEYRPLCAKELMELRLAIANSNLKNDRDIKYDWLDSEFFPSDVLLCHPDGRRKIVSDLNLLQELTKSTSVSRTIDIYIDAYDTTSGYELSKKFIAEVIPGSFIIGVTSRKKIMNHPIWNAFAQEDKSLLLGYSQLVFHYKLEGIRGGNRMDVFNLDCLAQSRSWSKTCYVDLLVMGELDKGSYVRGDGGYYNLDRLPSYAPSYVGIKKEENKENQQVPQSL